jgi:hypothetical protein
MRNLLNREEENCRRLRDALEELPAAGDAEVSVEECLGELSEAGRAHVMSCEACREALEELVETRIALRPMAALTPDAGPWFTARVMSAIAAKEKEEALTETDGVWLNVRKFAPRLAAVSVLLLIIGGTWVVQLRQAEAQQASKRTGDFVFDASTSPVWSDDGITSGFEVRP